MTRLPESAHTDGTAIARAYDSQAAPTIRRWIIRFTSRSPLFGCWHETEGSQITVEHDVEAYLGGRYLLTEWTPELAAECAVYERIGWEEAVRRVSEFPAPRVHRRIPRRPVAHVDGVAVSDAADAMGGC